jgi:hypothetical protein
MSHSKKRYKLNNKEVLNAFSKREVAQVVWAIQGLGSRATFFQGTDRASIPLIPCLASHYDCLRK